MRLQQAIQKYGTKNWCVIAAHVPDRHPKQCRERWINHLDPTITKGKISDAEWDLVLKTHVKQGNRWSEIAKLLPGRTPNQIKNYWHTMSRRAIKRQRDSDIPGDELQTDYNDDIQEDSSFTESPSPFSSPRDETKTDNQSPRNYSGSPSLLPTRLYMPLADTQEPQEGDPAYIPDGSYTHDQGYPPNHINPPNYPCAQYPQPQNFVHTQDGPLQVYHHNGQGYIHYPNYEEPGGPQDESWICDNYAKNEPEWSLKIPKFTFRTNQQVNFYPVKTETEVAADPSVYVNNLNGLCGNSQSMYATEGESSNLCLPWDL